MDSYLSLSVLGLHNTPIAEVVSPVHRHCTPIAEVMILIYLDFSEWTAYFSTYDLILLLLRDCLLSDLIYMYVYALL